MWEETIEEEKRVISTTICGQPTNGIKWVDLFVQEMMNSKDFDDARGRAARILEAFEKCICAQTRVSEEVFYQLLINFFLFIGVTKLSRNVFSCLL